MPGQLGLDAGQVVMIIDQLYVGLVHGAAVDEIISSAQQVPRGPHLLGIVMSQGEITTPHELCDLLELELVVLGLPAADGSIKHLLCFALRAS